MSTQVKHTATRTYLSSGCHLSPSLSDPVAAQAPDTNRVISEHTPSCPSPTSMSLENMDVEFPDGSQWQIESSLSDMSLQLEHSPCEARQVFTARCIFDPANDYDQHVKAIIKVAFQVRASQDTIAYYQDRVAVCKEDLTRHPDYEVGTTKEIKRVQERLNLCTQPTKEANSETFNEVYALERFLDRKCDGVPWLAAVTETTLSGGLHPLEIVDGFLVFTLMTKMRGKPLSYEYLASMECKERNRVRQGFKEALMNIWKCGIHLTDSALKNILWNEEEGTCSIVGFKHCLLMSAEEKQSIDFTDDMFRYYSLDEERYEISDSDVDSDADLEYDSGLASGSISDDD